MFWLNIYMYEIMSVLFPSPFGFLSLCLCNSQQQHTFSIAIASMPVVFRKIVLGLLLSSHWLENSQVPYTLQISFFCRIRLWLPLWKFTCAFTLISLLLSLPCLLSHLIGSMAECVLIKSFSRESVSQGLLIFCTQPKLWSVNLSSIYPPIYPSASTFWIY